ncbi:major allergen Pru ar 1-like [Pyrus ussuriensis x Pyrus communis]|uniref:Major allergen Pru ar 1-like n=1 Tax=Pyrus ussuriensis x Pyrus communis TaxID=2448454 RepID=A0A5N5FPS6_9ROSA|nr:major allergen Pru ar 1-like [Pyrus ussuriensis x Pyrus communis]
MSSISSRQEFTSPVAADRLFKALITDSDNLIPKLMPTAIKSIEIIHGDGGVGSIKQINFAEYTLDVENLVCKYPLVEGDVLEGKIKSISYEVSFQASPNGGCTCKMMSEYDAAGDLEINEEEIRGGKERAMGMYKIVEAYLFESPGAYE